MVSTLMCTDRVCLMFIKDHRVGEYEILDQTLIRYL